MGKDGRTPALGRLAWVCDSEPPAAPDSIIHNARGRGLALFPPVQLWMNVGGDSSAHHGWRAQTLRELRWPPCESQEPVLPLLCEPELSWLDPLPPVLEGKVPVVLPSLSQGKPSRQLPALPFSEKTFVLLRSEL